mmetsp:Transcript_9162/g.13556  ORF Transcript_9162/g.13556 Transcript_9162/m.13556 type:complete len:440 (-) Transcript_9162:51-1370(-)
MGGDTRYITNPSSNIRSIAYNQDGSCLVVTSKNNVSILSTGENRLIKRLKTKRTTEMEEEKKEKKKEKELNIKHIKSMHMIGTSQYAVIVGHDILDPKYKSKNVEEVEEGNKKRKVHLDNHVLIVRDIQKQQTMSYFVSKYEILNVQLNQHVMFVLTRKVLYILNPLTMEQLYGLKTESAHDKNKGWDRIHLDPTTYQPNQIPSTFILAYAPVAYYQNEKLQKPLVDRYQDIVLEKHEKAAWTVVYLNDLASTRRKRRGMNLNVMNSGWSRPVIIKKVTEGGPIACVALSKDGSLLASCSELGHKVTIRSMTKIYQIGCCDLGQADLLQKIEPLYEFDRGSLQRKIHSLDFSPNNDYVAALSDHGTLHIFSLKLTGKEYTRVAFAKQSSLDTSKPSICKFIDEFLVHVVSASGSSYLIYFNPINGKCHINRSGDLSKYV